MYSSDVQSFSNSIDLKPIDDLEIYFWTRESDLKKKVSEGYIITEQSDHIEMLNNGLIGCFAFVGKEYAHSTWICDTEAKKPLIDRLPFVVDFRRGETCSGASFTPNEYRRRGLYLHAYNAIFNWLKARGVKNDRFTIGYGNVGSRITREKFPVTIDSSIYKVVFLSRFSIFIKSVRKAEFLSTNR